MSAVPGPDTAQTILVLAKEPIPGRVKTRLQTEFTPAEAASLAAWAIADTLSAVRGSRAARKVLVWDGDPSPWNLEFESTAQAGGSLNDRLDALGLSVRLLPPLRDVDLPADAEHVSRRYPWLSFSRRHRAILDARAEQPAERLFDRAFTGGATWVSSTVDALGLNLARWSGEADDVDLMVVSRCEPPVVDLGCGPGRMVVALNRSGRSALGVDMSAAAVGASLRRGGLALHRRISDPLPGEGRWGTALLVDSNVGMGGDLEALLRRCSDLVGAGGLIICEADPRDDRDEIHPVVLSSDGWRSAPLPWGRIGVRTLARVASTLGLLVTEEWSAGGRVFVSLRKN